MSCVSYEPYFSPTKELRMLADSMSKLKVVQQKFCDSLENVEKLEKSEKGKFCHNLFSFCPEIFRNQIKRTCHC